MTWRRWKPQTLEDRFWSKVRKSENCWEWTACVNQQGYGQFNGKPRWSTCMLAHRVAWCITNGPIPEGIHILHRCDNPLCVRPDHLFLGDQADNMRDMAAKGRHRGMTGKRHPYDYRGQKLTREKAEQIREAKGKHAAIARKFGVSPSMVSRIKHGICWPEDAPVRAFIYCGKTCDTNSPA